MSTRPDLRDHHNGSTAPEGAFPGVSSVHQTTQHWHTSVGDLIAFMFAVVSVMPVHRPRHTMLWLLSQRAVS